MGAYDISMDQTAPATPTYDVNTNGGLNNTAPAGDFSFSDTLGNLWGSLKPLAADAIGTWGQVQIAQANAQAQAKLNALKQVNPTLSSNDPAAAQKVANQTLLQRWLPPALTGGASSGGQGQGGSMLVSLVVVGLVVVAAVWILRRIFR
jgi:hypothetical protein